MNSPPYLAYIAGSCVAALIALIGILSASPVLYGTVPGIIGGIMAAVATVQFLKYKTGLAAFIATICGFVYYQEFQANPVTGPDFSAGLSSIPLQDQVVGIVLSNLTTAMLLVSWRIVSNSLRGTINRWVPAPVQISRANIDHNVMTGFWVVFALVALPNVLFGKVVVGAIDNILYQRLTWAEADNYSGFAVWGGALGQSIANIALWATSLFFIWMYLLNSRHRRLMLILGPLVVLWTAGVVLQGSRTYLVTVGVALIVYFLGSPKFGKKSFLLGLAALPLMFLVLQITTFFRGTGLQSVNLPELAAHMFEIRGNEGASSQIDGIQCFRTEFVDKGKAANPVTGFVRGLVERPFEGLLMPVPRSLFPWKSVDASGTEFNLWFQNVRMGLPSDESVLGASPGLIGRELIKYGLFGPLTLLFWLGLLLGLADRLFSASAGSDFCRIFAALLIAFVVAQARDFAPVWFIPFLPAGVVFGIVARNARKNYAPGPRTAPAPHPAN